MVKDNSTVAAITAPEKAEEIASFTVAGVSSPPFLTLSALALASALSLFSILLPERFMAIVTALNALFMHVASDAVIVISSLLLLFCLIVVFSPLGRIRLGGANDRPEFSTLSWISMLFAAGMGAGLLYWGVAEPVIHLSSPPTYSDEMAEAGAARMAMVLSLLHWALHPWALYAAGSLCIAYFSFCRGFVLLPSAPFRAALPERFRISQAAGDIVDVACVIALLLGLSAAMAAGTMQIASGTKWLGNSARDGHMFTTYMAILIPMAVLYLLSACTNIDKGIRILSELNMVLAGLLAVLICFHLSFGRTLSYLTESVVDYLHFLPELSFTPLDSPKTPHWSETWTANYFMSWIAWVPFVGIFVARISKGRTMREFILGVVFAPSLLTLVWFAILGGAAIDIQVNGVYDLAADIRMDAGSALFSLTSLFPAQEYFWMLIIVLVFIFLVTGADSASYVLAMMAGRGDTNPSARSKLFWGLAIAALTSATLFSESGIHSVRAVFSFAGILVFFILIGQMGCLIWGLCKPPSTGTPPSCAR